MAGPFVVDPAVIDDATLKQLMELDATQLTVIKIGLGLAAQMHREGRSINPVQMAEGLHPDTCIVVCGSKIHALLTHVGNQMVKAHAEGLTTHAIEKAKG